MYSFSIEESIVLCSKTPNAYQRLIDGKTDIIFCYEPSAEQIAEAAKTGKSFHLTPICKDAFVFIVNENNPIENITTRQVRDIYSGRVKNWKTITGVNAPILAYQRPDNSGSQTIMQTIMKGETLKKPIQGSITVAASMDGIMEAVAAAAYNNYNSALGYSFLFYVNGMKNRVSGVKTLAIDGIKPDLPSIQSGAYPFTQTCYAVGHL